MSREFLKKIHSLFLGNRIHTSVHVTQLGAGQLRMQSESISVSLQNFKANQRSYTRRVYADNATDLAYPVLAEYKARQLDAAYALVTAICADEEPRDGGVSPPAISCAVVGLKGGLWVFLLLQSAWRHFTPISPTSTSPVGARARTLRSTPARIFTEHCRRISHLQCVP